MSSGFSHRAYVACGSVSYMGLMPEDLLPIPVSAIIFFIIFCCVL